jgi:hypothetical protein
MQPAFFLEKNIMEQQTQMTIREAAQLALDGQNACNLSGLVHTLARILDEALWPAAHESGLGTDWVNKHPIVTLTVDKLMSLNDYADPSEDWQRAYRAVTAMANQPR